VKIMNKHIAILAMILILLTACGKPSATGAVAGLPEESEPAETEAIVLDLYAMSQCPYGIQAENEVAKAKELLGENLKVNIEYIGGEKEGEWIYQVGDHVERGSYVIGLREGVWKYYYPDGSLKYEGSYSQGNPDKRHKFYYPDGSLKEEQYYVMGIREKNWKKYDKEGNLLMTITYKNNEELRINGVKTELPESDIKLIR